MQGDFFGGAGTGGGLSTIRKKCNAHVIWERKWDMAAKKTVKKKNTGMDLSKAADYLIKMAQEGGVEQNYFFTTTFTRYQVQIETMERLQAEMDGKGLFITKEYVKGKENIVINPAISEYNKTSTAANQTVQTLIRIIQTFAEGPVMQGTGKEEDGCDL